MLDTHARYLRSMTCSYTIHVFCGIQYVYTLCSMTCTCTIHVLDDMFMYATRALIYMHTYRVYRCMLDKCWQQPLKFMHEPT